MYIFFSSHNMASVENKFLNKLKICGIIMLLCFIYFWQVIKIANNPLPPFSETPKCALARIGESHHATRVTYLDLTNINLDVFPQGICSLRLLEVLKMGRNKVKISLLYQYLVSLFLK